MSPLVRRSCGESDVESAAIRGLDAVIPRLPALEVDFRIWYVAQFLDGEQFDKARTAIAYVRALALRMKHEHALFDDGQARGALVRASVRRVADHSFVEVIVLRGRR